MGRRSSWLTTTLAVAVALAVPAASGAQVPAGDSVTGTGTADVYGSFVIDARSGPSGENPTGSVSVELDAVSLAGPVTCLLASGNRARFNMSLSAFPSPFSGTIHWEVVDNAASGVPDTIAANILTRGEPADCSPLAAGTITSPLLSGDIVVVDRPRLPASTEQCKHGGWRAFRTFKNQGDCVSSVATRGGNPPGRLG
jgi:hypothetical protein